MRSLKIHRAAKAEIVRAADYYEQQQVGLGSDFRGDVETTINFIRQFPNAGASFQNTIYRGRRVSRFPHIIYYLDDGANVNIIAVAHGSRKPGYWLKRNPP